MSEETLSSLDMMLKYKNGKVFLVKHETHDNYYFLYLINPDSINKLYDNWIIDQYYVLEQNGEYILFGKILGKETISKEEAIEISKLYQFPICLMFYDESDRQAEIYNMILENYYVK